MGATEELLENNAEYAAGFGQAGLSSAPAKGIAIVTCMDARMLTSKILGLEEGDAHVIRNAGGVITDDEIRSLAISQRKLGTREIVLIQHTDCGLLKITDEEFADRLEAETGQRPAWSAHAFDDLDTDVREGIEKIRSSPFIPRKGSVRGFVCEVETGRLREVAS